MVYIYQSCSPITTFSSKLTQVIQTEKVSISYYPGLIFKDNNNICWTYLGEYENSYIAPSDVYYTTYQGNFFETNAQLIPIYYPDCDSCVLTQVNNYEPIYFLSEKCDDKTEVIVKTWKVVTNSNVLKLTYNVGEVCGILNPSGDDFCVILKNQIENVDSEYIIITPSWNYYDCQTCPSQKNYTVNSLDNLVMNYKVYSPVTSETIMNGTSIRLNTSELCYITDSYNGVKINYLYDSKTDPTINQTFTSSADCMINYYNTLL